jgi:hypothetical protein
MPKKPSKKEQAAAARAKKAEKNAASALVEAEMDSKEGVLRCPDLS